MIMAMCRVLRVSAFEPEMLLAESQKTFCSTYAHGAVYQAVLFPHE